MDFYYRDNLDISLTNIFTNFTFGFLASKLSIVNRNHSGSGLLIISFDGVNIHGRLSLGETFNVEGRSMSNVFLKYQNATVNYQLFSY